MKIKTDPIKFLEYFTHSYPRFGMFLVLMTTLLSIPFSIGILGQQQDIRQRAQEAQIAQFDGSQIYGGDNTGLPPGISCAAAGCYDQNGTPYYGNQQYPSNPQQNNQNCQAMTVDPNTGQMVCSNPYQQQQQPQQQTPAPVVASGGSCAVPENEIAMDPEEQKFVTLINQYRASLGLSQLTTSATLAKMSAWIGNDNNTRQILTHEPDSLGRTRYQRAADCGMTQSSLNSEILTGGVGNFGAQNAFQNFKNSSSHNVEMTRANLVQIGVDRNIALKANGFNSVIWSVNMQPYNDGTTAPTTNVEPTAYPTPTPITTVITGYLYPTWTPTPTTPQPTGTQPTGTTTTITPTVTPAATTAPTSTPIPVTEIAFELKLPGVGSTPNLNNNPVGLNALEVRLQDPNTKETVLSKSIDFTYDKTKGTFKGKIDATPGTYLVKVKTRHSLWSELGLVQVVNNNRSLTPTVTLITGDLNGDNLLNIIDYNILLSCFGGRSCADKAFADVNLDGKVDQLDLNIFYSGLANRQGD